MSTINSEVFRSAPELARVFRDAKPFRHVVIDDFLDTDICRRMLADFPGFEDRYALNEMGQVGGKAVRMDVRDVSDTYRGIDLFLQTPEFLGLISTITGIPDLLYDPDYVGGGTHENRDGQSLEQHVDFNFHPGTRWHRRLNLIVYLNPQWDDAWGGALELQADPWSGDTAGPHIAPLFNRAVVFETTENSWHGFSAIHLPDDKKSLSRKSFAIYLYTKERPPTETAAAHATVYVPPAMPTSLTAGTTLSAAQLSDLRGRFDNLRGQLKFLYDREKQFSSQIASLEHAVTEARAAFRLPLQGYAVQSSAPEGMWPDGWVGRDFHAQFVATKKAKALQIELWAPAGIGDQLLEIDLNGTRWQHHLKGGSRGTATLPCALGTETHVDLRIAAAQTVVPARMGASADERAIAWKLVSISLVH